MICSYHPFTGFVYTRMFSKALRALATLRAFKEEEAALEALLAQRLWRRGKRAKWYDRLALLRNRYLCVVEGPDGRNMKDKEVLRQAMQGVREALEDEDTSLSKWFVPWSKFFVSNFAISLATEPCSTAP